MKRDGFTLVEIMVALMVGALLVLVAHSLFRATTTASQSLADGRRALNRVSNAHRLLTSMLLSLEVGAAEQRMFEGHRDRLRFATWQETPDGWFEIVPVEIDVKDARLAARIGARSPSTLADSVLAVRFDYLLQLGANESWVPEWSSPLSAPLGIRLRISRASKDGSVVSDTALFQVKERK